MTTATPTRVTSIELAADTLTPVAAALRLGPRCAFLLESVEEGARYGRYSLVGVHAARNCGMRVIGLTTSHTGRELLAAGAERAVADFEGFAWPV